MANQFRYRNRCNTTFFNYWMRRTGGNVDRSISKTNNSIQTIKQQKLRRMSGTASQRNRRNQARNR